MNIREVRGQLIDEMVDVGDLIRKGDDIYEDMGGHILHESNLDPYIEQFIVNLRPEELLELKSRIGAKS